MDGLGLVAGVPPVASDGAVVVGVAHGRDGRTEGEGPLEGLAAEDLGDFAGPLGAHPVPQAPVAVVVPVRLVEVLEVGGAAPVDEVVAEHVGDAGEGVEDLEAAALLALELLDTTLVGGGDLADGGILAGEGPDVGLELLVLGLASGKTGGERGGRGRGGLPGVLGLPWLCASARSAGSRRRGPRATCAVFWADLPFA